MEPDTLTGQTIGHYVVLELLGEGGMGVVYKARDTRLGRMVALKVMRPDPGRDAAQRRRFLREAQAASALNHPGIVTVYEIDTAAGLDYIAMEYIAGGTLADRMAAGRLPAEQALRLMGQVADALSAAHAVGIVHRDLKPSNIMLASADHVKVVDFGLAKFTETGASSPSSEVTQSGDVMGTAPYMSPEQISGRAVEAHSDIFSLGTILYELLAGRRPFGEDSGTFTLARILCEAPVPLEGVSPDLAQLLDRCLRKNAEERYASAGELKAAIDEVLLRRRWLETAETRRLSVSTPSPDAPGKALRGVGRSQLGRVAAMAVAAAVVGTAAVLWLSQRAAGPRREPGSAQLEPAAPPAEASSIAVLPFVNMSPDPDQEYFSDGLSEELLDALSRIPQLRVISRTSSFQFKGKSEDVRTIAKKLNVAHVLEGSVRKSGKRIRITAQLVKASDGSHLWSRSYDRELDDIFAVQEDIARSVADASKLTLLGRDLRLATPCGDDAEVHNLYLQGKYFADRQSRENLEKAVSYYEQALKRDPGCARAWAGLARVYITQTNRGYDPSNKAYRSGRQAMEKALELDPELAEAHSVLGWVRTNYDWDWLGADSAFKRALEIEPRNGSIVGQAAILSATLGRFEEAIERGRRAVALDPLNAGAQINLGGFAYYAGRLDEAEAAVRKGIELDPEYPTAHLQLSQILSARSNPEAALAEIEREKEPIWRRFGMALVYHALGRKNEADAAFGELLEKDKEGGAFQIAEVYAFRGETDKAFEWLERAYALRDPGLSGTKGDPLLKNLEADPRHAAFLRKMRLPL